MITKHLKENQDKTEDSLVASYDIRLWKGLHIFSDDRGPVVKLLRGAGSLKFKKKLESQNEITIIDEYKCERQRVCEHRHIFLYYQIRNSALGDKPRDAFFCANAVAQRIS